MPDIATALSILGDASNGPPPAPPPDDASSAGGDAASADPFARKMDILSQASTGKLAKPAEPAMRTGLGANFAAGANDAIAGFLGAPADIVNTIASPARIAGQYAGDKLREWTGKPALTPDQRAEIFNSGALPGGSADIKSGMGLLGFDPRDVAPADTLEATLRGAGSGVAGMVAPSMAARTLVLGGYHPAAVAGGALLDAFTSGGPATLAGIGAGGGATGAFAQQFVPEPWKGLADTGGQLLGGGLVGGGIAGSRAALEGTMNAARSYFAPMTQSGQRQIAGGRILGAASQPGDLLGRLDAPNPELVPGSEPTTFQLTGDAGLGTLERGQAAKSPEDFIARRAAQNAARIGQIEGMAPEGSSSAAPGEFFRQQLAAIDAHNEGLVDAAQNRATAALRGLGGDLERNEYGQAIRQELADAKVQAKANESRLWNAIDPDGSLAMDVTSPKRAAARIAGEVAGSAKPPAGEEQAIYDLLAQYPDVQKFSEVTALRGRLLAAIREERFQNGQTPALRRMQQLRSAIDNSISSAAERPAEAAPAVAPTTGGATAAPMMASSSAAPVRQVEGRAVTFPDEAHATLFDYGRALESGLPRSPDLEARLYGHFKPWVYDDFGSAEDVPTMARDYAEMLRDMRSKDAPLVVDADRQVDYWRGRHNGSISGQFGDMAGPTGGAAPSTGSSIFTPSGRKLDVRYDVVDLAGPHHPIPSHTADLNPNPKFPAELQPRERSRAASQAQITNIARNLQPERLGASASALEGAPVVGPDNVVESGNARVLGIAQAYRENAPGAAAYRDFLRAQGFNVDGMAAPALIRRRLTDLSPEERVRFTQEANAGPGLAMSATERAPVDAQRLSPGVLELYRGGDVASAENRDFVRAFMRTVPERGEEGAFASPDGLLSIDGARRIRNALVQKAYGDLGLVGSLAETGDENIRAFGTALADAAGNIAKLRDDIGAGRVRADMDITRPLLDAAEVVRDARSRGVPIGEALAQRDAFRQLSPLADDVLRMAYGDNLDKRISRNKLADALRFYVEEAGKQSPEAQLFAGTEVKPGDILSLARSRYGGQAATGFPEPIGAEGVGPRFGAGRQEASGPGYGPAGQAATGGRGQGGGFGQSILPESPPLSPNFDAAAAGRYRAAADATRERVGTFNLGPVDRALRAGKNGAEYSLPDSQVAGAFFNGGGHGFEDAQGFLRAVGDRPRAVGLLQDYAASDLVRKASNPDGTLNPGRVEAWLNKNQDALRAFPELADRFRSASAAQAAVADAMVARRAAVTDYQNSAARHFLNAEPAAAVRRALGSPNPVREMADLARMTAADSDARAGLQRAVVEHLLGALRSNTEAGTSGQTLLKADQLQTWVRKNSMALAAIFSPEQRAGLEAVAADLQRANRSIAGSKLPGGSNTTQDVLAAGRSSPRETILQKLASEAVGGGAGYLLGGHIGAGIGIVGSVVSSAFRDAGLRRVDQLVTEAMLNPRIAHDLVSEFHAGQRPSPAILSDLARQLGALSMVSAFDHRGLPQPQNRQMR